MTSRSAISIEEATGLGKLCNCGVRLLATSSRFSMFFSLFPQFLGLFLTLFSGFESGFLAFFLSSLLGLHLQPDCIFQRVANSLK